MIHYIHGILQRFVKGYFDVMTVFQGLSIEILNVAIMGWLKYYSRRVELNTRDCCSSQVQSGVLDSKDVYFYKTHKYYCEYHITSTMDQV